MEAGESTSDFRVKGSVPVFRDPFALDGVRTRRTRTVGSREVAERGKGDDWGDGEALAGRGRGVALSRTGR